MTPPPIIAPPVLTAEHGGPAEVRMDEAGRIDEDLACRGCGYNLRGLTIEAACPECSASAGLSVRGDLLRFSDPAWVERLGRGMGWVIAGLISSIVVGIVGAVLLTFISAASTVSLGSALVASAFCTALASLVIVAGAWLVTAPNPGATETESLLTLRRLARWCIISRLVSAPLQMVFDPTGAVQGNTLGTLPTVYALVMTVGVVFMVAAAVGDWSALMYLRRLALRLPRASLAGSARIVAWGYALCELVGVVVVISVIPLMRGLPGMAAQGSPITAGVMVALGGVGCVITLGSLVFGVWGLVLMFLFRGAFGRAAEEARSTWAGAPASAG